MKDLKCEQRIDEALKGRLSDLRRLLDGEECEDLGAFAHYALGFDYVAPGTFDDQKEGYFRYSHHYENACAPSLTVARHRARAIAAT